MHNSGMPFSALSLDRPVLLPRPVTDAELAERSGHRGVLQDDDVMPSVLRRSVVQTSRVVGDRGSAPSGPRPDDHAPALVGLAVTGIAVTTTGDLVPPTAQPRPTTVIPTS